MRALVTGATGLIGSFLVEALDARGASVRALVRPTSDTSVLDGHRVEFVHGDLRDADSLRHAVSGMDVVFHTAARMTDWGEWKPFEDENVEGTRRLLDASREAGVRRFIHTSSTGVLGVDAIHNATENGEYAGEGVYEESKVESEKLALEYYRTHGLPVTVIRPCWTLGPRARRHIPLIVGYLLRRQLIIIGRGNNVQSFVDPRDVAEAMVLAAEKPGAVGQIYHITNGSQSDTQRECYNLLADALGVRPPSLAVPYSVSYAAAVIAERWATWRRWEDAPMTTPLRVKFVGLDRSFNCEKARQELGYTPRHTLADSLRDAVAWYRADEKRHAVANRPH